MKHQSNLNVFFGKSDDSSLENKILNADFMVTNFLVQHNLPIATADHLGLLFKAIFPNSQIAFKYAAARTKTSANLKMAMGPYYYHSFVEHCRSTPICIRY